MPSTLSPSTLFFGSFPHPSDSYGAYNGEEYGGDKADATMAHDVTTFDIGTKFRSGSGMTLAYIPSIAFILTFLVRTKFAV
jgi:hypothetical protein